MGLDMYLEREISIGGQYKSNGVKGQVEIDFHETDYDHEKGEWVYKDKERSLRLDANTISSIVQQVGYWRKANAIHNWFVEHVQDGVDECQRTYVEREKLLALKDTCQRVLDSLGEGKPEPTVVSQTLSAAGVTDTVEDVLTFDPTLANRLLPPKSGFFFGPTEINQWYKDDLEQTIDIINKALEPVEGTQDGDVYFYYESSW